MGALTVPNGVWYPDLTDIGQPNVWAATMAQSVDTGIGARLQKQEIAVGLKASLADSSFNFGGVAATIPYAINSGTGDFNNGFTLAGGVATVQTKGMYVVTANLGASTGTNTGLKVFLYQNNVNVALNEVPQNGTIWIGTTVSAVLNCVPNDTIWVKGAWTNSSPGTTTQNKQTAANYISIAMVQAVA